MKPAVKIPPLWVARRSASGQRGVVLFFALIVLVILLIGGIAVVRSINASLSSAGNLAFRRDLVTQSDAVVAQAMQAVTTVGSGAIGSIPDLKTSQPQFNYSAVALNGVSGQGVSAQGIPNALFSDSLFSSVATAGNDITTDKTANNSNGTVTIRYLIERMCSAEGPATMQNCVYVSGAGGGPGGSGPGGGTGCKGNCGPRAAGSNNSVVYRLSYRVTGPRGTQAFFQAMFTGPS
ncbi:MAG: hypothetical protein LBH31_06540 [Burkholderiaceae bacterium]|jgi:Tfp pilus assembly protein PilX|nr:hypothetical protein [Burkholderiaceae bacterium]